MALQNERQTAAMVSHGSPRWQPEPCGSYGWSSKDSLLQDVG